MASSFTATFSGDQEVPANGTTASGSGAVAWDASAQTAAYEFTVQGVDFGPVLGREAQTAETSDDVTIMHVHNAARGVNGPVVFGMIGPAHDNDDLRIVLNDLDGSWTVSGIWETTDLAAVSIASFADVLSAATAGADAPFYFNVHTTTFPGGEIRGQWVAQGTGEDGSTDGPAPEAPATDAVDWDALAARVLAFQEATGSWGLLSEWLSDTPPDGLGDGEDHGTAMGDWYL